MNVILSGELTVGENVRLVFDGKPWGARVYVGETLVKRVTGFRLVVSPGSADLSISVDALQTIGELNGDVHGD